MSATITEPEVQAEPKLSDGAPPCWPPVAHLIRPEDRPAREGTIALCGAKLMGIDLGHYKNAQGMKLCPKCEAIRRQENGL